MFPRLLEPPADKSFFLFGPRGTGKSTWVQAKLPEAFSIDLLESDFYTELLAVDFVLYGQRGLRAFEVKRTPRVRDEDLRGLRAFVTDYPMATAWLVYGGSRRYRDGPIEVIPIEACLRELPHLLGA